MEIIILTGMSGSGKSKVADYLEDMGYFCVDNLPPRWIPMLVTQFLQDQGLQPPQRTAHLSPHTDEAVHRCPSPDQPLPSVHKLAFVIDVRSAGFFDGVNQTLSELDQAGLSYRLIFLDSTDEALLSRYKQTRRVHPLAKQGGMLQAIGQERLRLAPLRQAATDLIDTTNFSLADLRDYIYKLLTPGRETRMTILVESFGFKYGVPVDADLVLDVRFLPNPYYDPQLRGLTGRDEPVANFVLADPLAQQFLRHFQSLIEPLLPAYIREGKVRLTLCVGCTGGRHRSVAMAEQIAKQLSGLPEGYVIQIHHRDQAQDPQNLAKQADYQQNAASLCADLTDEATEADQTQAPSRREPS